MVGSAEGMGSAWVNLAYTGEEFGSLFALYFLQESCYISKYSIDNSFTSKTLCTNFYAKCMCEISDYVTQKNWKSDVN